MWHSSILASKLRSLQETQGDSVTPNHLARRLRAIGVDIAARRAALLHLCGDLPAAVVADLLGIHIATAITWSRASGRPWADYIEVRTTGRPL